MKPKFIIPIKLKLFLPVMIIIMVVVAITSAWFINRSIHSFNAQIGNNLQLEVQTITKMFERESILKLEKVQTNLKVANLQFFSKPLNISGEMITVEVENQQTNKIHGAVLPVWYLDEQKLYDNYNFVDFMENVIGGSITVFQKFDSGYVRISTNIRRSDGSRAVGTYIPNNSPVAKTVSRGEVYYGRAIVVDEWYTTAYQPIYNNNDIVGLLYVGDKEKDMDELKRILNKLKIGKSGHPFVFDKNGILLIHPYNEGMHWKDSAFMTQILGKSDGVINFKHENHSKTAAFRYFEKFELYVAASILTDVENRELVQNAVAGAIVVAIIAVLSLMLLIYRFTTERLYKYLNALELSKAKLATAEEALKQSEKLAHMGQISAGIAHELNNPLGVITMYSNIVLDELPTNSHLRPDMELIVEQADRCKKIVSGLLNFARKNKVKASEVNIVKFLNHSLNSVVIPDNIKAEVIAEIDDPTIMLDSDQMLQVFTNLEKNAVEAMPKGGKLIVSVKGDENNVEIVVSDTGMGIPKENMDKLFTPFFTTKQLGKGTGLGLPLVYGIVKMHKGKINVVSNSDPDQGATGTKFIIKLPRIL